MRPPLLWLGLAMATVASAVVIDRIAIVAGNSIVKDSDIEREIRMTEFLNGEPVSITPAARKSAAGRLLDQTFIRQEVRAGDYSRATPQQAEQQLEALKQQRFRSAGSFEAALKRYGIAEQDLQRQMQWQLTALDFIELRFKPAAYVSDEDVRAYYEKHAGDLRKANPGKRSLDELRPVITSTLTEEKVNQLFFAWLDEQRKNANVQYFEESLR